MHSFIEHHKRYIHERVTDQVCILCVYVRRTRFFLVNNIKKITHAIIIKQQQQRKKNRIHTGETVRSVYYTPQPVFNTKLLIKEKQKSFVMNAK